MHESVIIDLCCFSVSQSHVYHFINESKSWEEARNFCSINYTDLATVENMDDTEMLIEVGAGAGAWIGLYNRTEVNRVWLWSLPGLEFDESDVNWKNKEPNDEGGVENCVYIDNSKMWHDGGCEAKRCFICYNNDTGPRKEENDCRNWTEAQHFCRENHGDLISGGDQLNELKGLGNCKCECGHDNEWWIGLSRDTWGWSDGSNSSFRKWSRDDPFLSKGYLHDNRSCVKVGPKGTFIRDHYIFILVNENKTFEEALYHCRRHYGDLAWFIDQPHLKSMARQRAKMADSEDVWVGLYYTCALESWIWVNGHYVDDMDVSWRHPGESECGVAGAMEKGGENQWVKRNSWERLNFICSRERDCT
uniref:C-type lectin domain-containing protein n=1 Tax=Periophthalmus magnuspinnatus TaxID=409849 RepID=A0A3B3ZBC8_9GOBI